MFGIVNNKVTRFFKKDPVLVISGILAVLSCLFVLPDEEYVSYINYRVLVILFALMLVVGALGDIGAFDHLTGKMLSKVRNIRSAVLILVVLSFFLSMFMTNDVTLVTLVPFAMMTVGAFNDHRNLMYSLILMTVAANLGSMLTPIGNPQNLYLYSQYEMSMGHFLLLTLPCTLLSLLLLIVSCFVLIKGNGSKPPAGTEHKAPSAVKLTLCILLFAVALLVVTGYLHYLIMLGIVTAVMLFLDPKAFKKVDYTLLITFVFFFILIGNLGRVDVIYDTLSSIVSKDTVLTAVLSSQIISNVPAAMLLSAFTGNGDALVIGTNLGGLGTLIASMASLITYKIYIKENRDSGKYIAVFTVVNIVFLAVLYCAYRFVFS